MSNVYTWGRNNCGQLGNNTTTSSIVPINLTMNNLDHIVVGGADATGFTLGIEKTTGLAYAWGYNVSGQLGTNDTTSYSIPKSVLSTTSWASIAVGQNGGVVAINGANGLAYAWGEGGSGQIGNNNKVNCSIPVSVSSTISWKQVTCGAAFALGINGANGLAYAWGGNTYGALGTGNTTGYSVPTSVSSTISWKQLAGGAASTVGINGANGLAYAWGYNASGNLGDNSVTHRSVPTSVSSTISWASIATNGEFTVGIDGATGLAYAWGNNGFGQLGTGNTTSYSVPTSVSSTISWTKVTCGYYHALAIAGDGKLYGWGNNAWGQLGTGNTTSYSVPTSVSSSNSFMDVATAWYETAALRGLVAPTVTTQAASSVWWGSMIGNGNVTDLGAGTITSKGIAYKVGTTGDPTVSDSVKSTTGNATGAYTVNLLELNHLTGYRLRAFATSEDGTGYGETVQETTLKRATAAAPRPTEIDLMEYPTDAMAAEVYVSDSVNLVVTSGTTKSEGTYSLKSVATQTTSLNKTITRTMTGTDQIVSLVDCNTIQFDIYASRTGSNIKIGIKDSDGTVTEITPNVTDANTWQTVPWDISAVANANKDSIYQIIIAIVNADAANTFYVDNFKIASTAVDTTEISNPVVAGRMKTGDIAFVNGVKITGTGTQTLSATSTTVTAGYYETADLATIDEDLITTSIITGKTVFGVVGAAVQGGKNVFGWG